MNIKTKLSVKDLHQYQRKCCNTILARDKLFLLLDMGLGKSVSVLTSIEYLQRERGYGPALIIAPLRVCYSVYPDEIKKWDQLKNLTYHIIHGPGKTKPLPKANLYIANFESLQFVLDSKVWQKCDILVIDEITFVKNSKTKRFQILKKMVGSFKKKIGMTGSPSGSGELTEFFSMTYLLDEGKRLGTSFWQFRNKYYSSDFMGYKWELKPGARKRIEDKIRPISITMTAKDYLDMPDKTYNNILVDLPTKAKDIYLEMEKEFIVQLQDDTITAANAAVKTSKLRQITAGCLYSEEHKYKIIHKAKIDALKEIIEGIDGNVLLGFQFKFERDMIQQAIPEARFIDGSTNMKDSMQNIKDFNSNKIKLLCCHPASTSHGINLQKFCNTLVWLSRDFSLERTGQYEARIHRQGQTKKVFIHTIACKNTIDLAVIAALSRKSEGQSATINALKDYVKNK